MPLRKKMGPRPHPIFDALRRDAIEALLAVLMQDPCAVFAKHPSTGGSTVHWAARHAWCTNATEILLLSSAVNSPQKRLDLLNAPARNGTTPAAAAAAAAHFPNCAALETLARYGACFRTKDANGLDPIGIIAARPPGNARHERMRKTGMRLAEQGMNANVGPPRVVKVAYEDARGLATLELWTEAARNECKLLAEEGAGLIAPSADKKHRLHLDRPQYDWGKSEWDYTLGLADSSQRFVRLYELLTSASDQLGVPDGVFLSRAPNSDALLEQLCAGEHVDLRPAHRERAIIRITAD